MKEGVLSFRELAVNRRDIFVELGYGDSLPETFIQEQVDMLCGEVSKFLRARYAYRLFPGVREQDRIRIRELPLHTGKLITSVMKGASAFAVFAATAGWEFEMYMREVVDGKDVFLSYLLGAIGSCIAEKAGDRIEQQLETEIGELFHTNRFSPGYCNWPLTDQKQLFELLEGNHTGITLSRHSLMTPIKSISGVIGIGQQVKQKMYGCGFCDNKNCYKRKNNK